MTEVSSALRAEPATVPSLSSRIFLILGYQILMILCDFGCLGAHFLMIFEYFGCLGTLPGGLGAHFEPKARIFVILEIFPPEILVPFWLLFWYFLGSFFSAFSGTLLEGTFCQIWCQKHPKWEAFGGHFEVIFGKRRFLDFWYPYCTKPYILRSGGYPKCIIFGDFFEGALREASGTRFFAILSDFGIPVGAHLAPKRQQKMRPKKWWKKGAQVADLGPL